MDKQTKGAWVVHHGRKVAADLRGAAEFSAIDIAAKSASLLARMAESDETTLGPRSVEAAGRVGGLSPKTELVACLNQLQARKLIDRSTTGEVVVLGVTTGTALTHAADLFEDNDPQPLERAAIDLAERTSTEPLPGSTVVEYLSDTHHIISGEVSEFVEQAAEIGFVDSEGDGDDRLFFNGNLFRRDTASKTRKVLDSFDDSEARKLVEFQSKLASMGSIQGAEAERTLGTQLFAKLKAAALVDLNVVSNEAGDHVFVTAPQAFQKFVNPMVDDAFDHAKALVAALSYGMSISPTTRGRIWGVELLLNKLIRGEEVGPATAIGNDYRALELERVVQTRRSGYGYMLKLLKREVGILALEVLKGRNASATALETLPSAGMRSYVAPEANRVTFRKNQSRTSKAQTRSLLSAVRGGGRL